MTDRGRRHRSPFRYVAPLALAATFAGIYLIVSHGLHTGSAPRSGGSSSTSHNGPGTGTSQTNPTPSSTHGGGPTFYVVRSGDTLSEIALRTHVPVVTIERLNAGISANSLRVGQRLRLRR